MKVSFTPEEKDRIREGIRRKYTKVALGPEGNFRYPTGCAGLEALKYDSKIVGLLPDEVASSFCGVGNPFILGPIRRGDRVLDVGCGAGVDAVIAGMAVGPWGWVVGVDVVPEMIERAKESLRKAALDQVEFIESSAEHLDFPDSSFDAVISNGALNLVPDKRKALGEIFRVLKPGGRLMIADQISTGESPSDTKSMIETWAG